MSDTLFHFDKRVRKISRKNRRLARGSEKYIDAMGIMRERPVRRLPTFPIKGLLILTLGLFAFKGILLAHQGQVGYDDRLALLQEGTAFEQAGAWLMQVDPISARFAEVFAPLL